MSTMSLLSTSSFIRGPGNALWTATRGWSRRPSHTPTTKLKTWGWEGSIWAAPGTFRGAAGARLCSKNFASSSAAGQDSSGETEPAGKDKRVKDINLDMPVSVFWDLDNQCPGSHSRADIRELVGALRDLANSAGKLSMIVAAANKDTLMYQSSVERIRREDIIEFPDFMDEYSREDNFSGWDVEEEVIRCGVCGQKFKEHKKLEKHFKNLHLKEAGKLQRRPAKHRKKEWVQEKLAKYRAAAVGVTASGDIGNGKLKKKGSNPNPKSSQLKTILKENGVQVFEVPKKKNAADELLISKANDFLNGLQPAMPELLPELRGMVVLISGDADFGPLLKKCKQKNLATVVATVDEDVGLSAALLDFADIRLRLDIGIAEPLTEAGQELHAHLKL